MISTRAFVVGKSPEGQAPAWSRSITDVALPGLADGDVLVRVEYSGVNYKDGLASSATGRVARIDPLIPGIDLAGTVVESNDASVAVGTVVIAHGYDLGVAHHGGYAGLAQVPAGWVVPMPVGLDCRTAMLIGTAGYTAALSVDALQKSGLTPGTGPVLVTGATGGVGSVAVGILAALGYEVVASTGKADSATWLRSLGAAEVIERAEASTEPT